MLRVISNVCLLSNACERLNFLNVIEPLEDFVDFSKTMNIQGYGAYNNPVFCRKLHI